MCVCVQAATIALKAVYEWLVTHADLKGKRIVLTNFGDDEEIYPKLFPIVFRTRDSMAFQ